MKNLVAAAVSDILWEGYFSFLDKKLLGCIMSFNYIPKEASIIKNSDTQCNQ
jgi:hypothetical protein